MAWDASRRVPWRRLLGEWLVVTVVIAALFALVFHVDKAESYVGLLIGGVMYVAIAALLAKFGYQRATLKDLRAAPSAATAERTGTPTARPKPAPTRRTSTGPSQRPNRSNKARGR